MPQTVDKALAFGQGFILGLKRKESHQNEMEFVSIEALVPKDHLLRKIDKLTDLSFIYNKVEHLYCSDNGSPPIDPVPLFKMLLIGYLFG